MSREIDEMCIFNVILTKAQNGVPKNRLQSSVNISKNRFKDILEKLLEKGLLICDETNLHICENGQPRNVIYRTSEKGSKFIIKFLELQQLLEEGRT